MVLNHQRMRAESFLISSRNEWVILPSTTNPNIKRNWNFHLAHLACPAIADDSLAYEDTDVSQGGRKSATASGRLRGKFGIPLVLLSSVFRCPSWSPMIVSCPSSQPRELLLLLMMMFFFFRNRWVNAFDPIFHFLVPTLDVCFSRLKFTFTELYTRCVHRHAYTHRRARGWPKTEFTTSL